LIKTAAQKLNKVAGDGTTTVTVLTYNILNEANKLIAAGVNPMELRKGIEKAGAEIIKGILETAGEPLSREEIVKRVLKTRKVKETTILLNLQNKNFFKKVDKNSYTLA
ncbi:TCP-1/cpn60 chaperonin family protein, partial [Ralstonia pseudosolanacearum]|uniref:TCP-1/cpn60 chaperonin family protein n=1 Tax=Ralstonia pseudosolanacearum TaxID=1310165 RepID=UPI003D168B9F